MLSAHLEVVTKKLDAIGKNDPRVIRIQTIPGVGPRTAEIIVACIDDPHRFKNGRQVSAYFGLVPRKFQSGEMDRNGRITKRGNPLARAILTECAWASLRYNSWAKAIFERISGKQKTRRKKAAIALARKIAVIAWAMLRDGKDWDPKTMMVTTEKFGKIPLELKEKLLEMKPKKCRQTRMNRLESQAHNSTKAASAKAAVKAQAVKEETSSYTETLRTKTKPTSRNSTLAKKISITRKEPTQRRARKRAATTDAVATCNMTSTE
jgi:transposase